MSSSEAPSAIFFFSESKQNTNPCSLFLLQGKVNKPTELAKVKFERDIFLRVLSHRQKCVSNFEADVYDNNVILR